MRPNCERATSLDPNFANAYALLGIIQSTLGRNNLAAEYVTKAYELRNRASEREKFAISATYYFFALGDVEKAAQTSQLWSQTYSQDERAFQELGNFSRRLGREQEALTAYLGAVRLDPTAALNYMFVAGEYIRQGRLDEARATIRQARAGHLDSPSFTTLLCSIDFLAKDTKDLAEEESRLSPANKLSFELSMAAYKGQLSRARDLTQSAIASATQANAKEAVAGMQAAAAWREALFGNSTQARRAAMDASNTPTSWDTQGTAALALAFAGDQPEAQKLAADLNRRFPESTDVQSTYLPAIRARLTLNRGKPQEAIENLRAASAYELGMMLTPIFVRGEGYLAEHQGAQATAEFQKILDHPGIVVYEPIGSLTHLQIGRACAMQGDTAKARTAYEDFLALWKDADPDIPILKQAKAEYAKLQ